MRYMVVVLLSCVSLFLNCSDKAINRDVLPYEVRQVLRDHTQELRDFLKECNTVHPDARMGMNVTQKTWLPGWYIKCGVERVANRDRLAAFIGKRGFDKISVADKYLYHVEGMPEDLSNENYLVLVKVVSGICGKGQNVSLGHVQQLHDLAIEMRHYDLHPGNYVMTQEGKLVIIDTDKIAMPSPEEIVSLDKDWILNGTGIYAEGGGIRMSPKIVDPLMKLELAMYSKWPNYDERAYAYLAQKVRDREIYRLSLQKKLNEGYIQ